MIESRGRSVLDTPLSRGMTGVGVARKANILEADQSDLPRPVLLAKIFPFQLDPNQLYIPRRLVPSEGRIAIVTDAGRDAVDAAALGARRDRRAGFHSLGPVSDQTAC